MGARMSKANERERSDGWAEKGDIINTQPLEKLLKFFK